MKCLVYVVVCKQNLALRSTSLATGESSINKQVFRSFLDATVVMIVIV